MPSKKNGPQKFTGDTSNESYTQKWLYDYQLVSQLSIDNGFNWPRKYGTLRKDQKHL